MQAKFLGDAIPPVFAVTARAVRADRAMGYQIAAYWDRATSRIQIVLVSTANNDKRKICTDAVLYSKHTIDVSLALKRLSF